MKRTIPLLHPLLLASYPVVDLLVHNVGDIPLHVGLRPWLLAIVLASLLAAVGWLLWRDLHKAGLAASVVILVSFSYGHLYDGLKQVGFSGEVLVRHRVLIPFVLILLLLILAKIHRAPRIHGLTSYLNFFALVLVALPLVMNGSDLVRTLETGRGSADNAACSLRLPEDDPPRDVYLIVMDAYERADVLQELHGFDNGPFIERLELLGFYVPPASMSNYRFTVLSLASVLNMDYIQAFPDRYDPASQSRWGIAKMIPDNRVRRELECLGYVTATVNSGLFWTDWPSASFYFSRDGNPYHALGLLRGISRFEALLLETTIARAPMDMVRQMGFAEAPAGLDPRESHRELVNYQFDQLAKMPQLPSPKFVYVHVISPHPPFVFGREDTTGQFGSFEEEFASEGREAAALRAYADQVAYLNERLEAVVGSILQASEPEPIIVITADHGWADRNPEDKLSIFQAYYFPGERVEGLYPTISAVNTFRVVFDSYFGTEFGTLPDVGYYSVLGDIWDFERVENSLAH